MDQIIRALEEATGLEVKPFGNDSLTDCICYRWVPQSDSGCVAVYQLEIRIITKLLSTSLDVRKQVLDTLVTVGDQPKLGYNMCYLNGGGQLYDDNTKMIHTLMYLYITMKSEVSYNG